MKLKKWIFVLPALIIFAACGDNSTTADTSNDSTESAAIRAPNDKSDDKSTASETIEVPNSVRTNFETKYSGASNVTWSYYREPYPAIDWEWTSWPTLDERDYVVRYNRDGIDYYSWYDQDGNWVGTVNPVSDPSSLPSSVNNAVKNEFPGYSITSVDKQNDKDREAYEIELENGDQKAKALVDANGKVWKKSGAEGKKEKADIK